LAIFTRRLTGLEPADNGANSRPGLWLPGAVVTAPVTDWSFTDKIPPVKVETRTACFLPYPVTTNNSSHNGKLYVTATYFKGDGVSNQQALDVQCGSRSPRCGAGVEVAEIP
jgi:hypothetical protein